MLFEKAGENQAARQYSRHRGPEESRDAKHAYSLKASHVIRMPDEDFQRKFSMEKYRRETTLKVTRRNATKTP